MTKTLVKVGTAAALALSGLCAHANTQLDVTVVAVNDKVVTVKSAEPLPEWVREGAIVTAAGWSSTIKPILAQTFELHFDDSQQGSLEPNAALTVRAPAQESDGFTCG